MGPRAARPHAFFDDVSALDDAWQPQAERAAASVALALDDAPVQLDPAGRFALGPGDCGKLLVATDGAGGRTGLRLTPCRYTRGPSARFVALGV